MIEVKISSAGGSPSVGFSMKDGCDLSKLKFDKEASCTWLTLSKGTSEISLTATKNERSDPRTCYITPSYDGVVCAKNVFAVTQDGSGEPPTPPTPTTCTCSITITGGTLPKAGYSEFTKIGTYTISSTCSGTWGTPTRIDGDESFVSEFDFSNNEIKVKVPENTRQLRRTKYKATIGVGDCSAEFTVEQEGTGPSGCDMKVIIRGLPNGKTAKIVWGEDGAEEIAGSGEYIHTTNKSSLNVSVVDETGDYQFDPNSFTLSCDGPTAKTFNAIVEREIQLSIPNEYFNKGNTFIISGNPDVLTDAQIRNKDYTGSAIIVGSDGIAKIGLKKLYATNCVCLDNQPEFTASYNIPNNTSWVTDKIEIKENDNTYYVVNIDGNTATTIGSFTMEADDFNDCSDTVYNVPLKFNRTL